MCLEEETSGMENRGRDRRVWFCMYMENLGYVCLSAKTGMCVSVCGVTGVSMWRERWGWCRDRDVCVCNRRDVGTVWREREWGYAGRFRQAVEGEMSVLCMYMEGWVFVYVCLSMCVERFGCECGGRNGYEFVSERLGCTFAGRDEGVYVFGEMGDMQRWVCVHG